MLEDRDYMRDSEFGMRSGGRWSLTTTLIVVNAGIFLLQVIAEIGPEGRRFINRYLALSLHGLRDGFVWQPVTFQFLHANLLHLLANLFTIYFFGRAMEDALGRVRFVSLYFSSGIVGGLLQIVGTWMWPSHFGFLTLDRLADAGVVGASAGAFGLVAAFAMLFPNRLLTLLLFFVIPFSLKARYLLIGEIALTLLGILSPRVGGNIAHLAHLGGILVGVGFVTWLTRQQSQWRFPRNVFKKRPAYAEVAVGKAAWPPPRSKPTEELPPAEFISKQVDPILDKISAHGIHSLTPQEKRILEAASAKINKR